MRIMRIGIGVARRRRRTRIMGNELASQLRDRSKNGIKRDRTSQGPQQRIEVGGGNFGTFPGECEHLHVGLHGSNSATHSTDAVAGTPT